MQATPIDDISFSTIQAFIEVQKGTREHRLHASFDNAQELLPTAH